MVNKHATQWFLRFTLLALWFAGGAVHGQSVVLSFAPASGAPGTSVILTLTGANFLGATQVRFNTVDAIFEVLSSSQIAATVPLDALTGQISVTTTSGGTRSSSSSFFVAPRITGFSPPNGLAGVTVVISGANFINGFTTVQFNGVTANAPVVTADSQISATVPVGATNGFITVTTTQGGVVVGVATSADAFTVSNAPRVADFSPTIAKYGDRVVINGINFIAGTTVQFNGVTANATVTAATQISATVPNGATTGPITVTNANGTFTTSTNFVTGAGPIITGFSPVAGVAGDPVTITGINFVGATTLQFNNTFAGRTITSDTQIIAIVPNGATTGPIRITRAGITGISTNDFHVGPVPVITDFSPTNGGPVGTSVVLNGANLGGSTVIKFNGVTAGNVVVTGQNGTQISVPVPTGATTGLITAGNATATNSSAAPFIVTGPGPFINSFSPGSGPVGGNVIIDGGNFVNVLSVSFNGISASGMVTSPTQLQATVPVGATTGPISVTTASGTGTTTTKFFVWPRITGFSPATGAAGASVSITGANFTNATAVQFNGAAASFTVNSSTNLTATVPADALTGTLSVTTPAGIVASTTNFFILPAISSFDPAAGSVGTSVLISGSALLGATTVKFNGTTAIFSVVSRRQIFSVVPNLATSGRIVVTTSDGTATSASDFKILPGITGFSPASGGAGGTVVITGTSFAGVTGVYFNGESAAFTNNSPTQITATIPFFATPGRIAVATADGISTSATDFQVLPILYIGALAGQNVLVGWPTWATNFILEVTTNLVPTVVWTTVTNAPGVQGGENLITNNAASGKKFYRMKKQ